MTMMRDLLCVFAEGLHLYCEKPTEMSQGLLSSDNVMLFLSTLLGAIVGAGIGGLVQYEVSKHELTDSREQKKLDQQEKERAIATSFLIKSIIIANQLASIDILLKSMMKKAEDDGHAKIATWQKILPITGISSEPEQFSVDEIGVMFRLKLFDLANEALLLNDRFKTTIDGMHLYNQRRISVTDALPATIEGPVAVSDMPKESAGYFIPKFFELDEIITVQIKYIDEYTAAAVELCDTSAKKFVEIFGKDFAMKLDIQHPKFNVKSVG